MSANRYISEVTQNQVRQRANYLCEFIWSADGLRIIGLTPTGRATVAALAFNRERIINIRAADIEIGRHLPPSDPKDFQVKKYPTISCGVSSLARPVDRTG